MADLKLNLGSGQNPAPGFINVDKFGTPDVQCDLEQFPWPWDDNAVAEVRMSHVLEHLGETTATFIGIIKELYRVCRDGALIRITVPHPRNDDFLNDPTHVRIITPEIFTLFSKQMNKEWKRIGAASSPLADYHGVDLEIVRVNQELTPEWSEQFKSGKVSEHQLAGIARAQNNVIKQTQIELRVIKPASA